MNNMTTIWKTKEGKEIPIQDLSIEHLRNIIAFLYRKAEYAYLNADSLYGFGSRDNMASYYSEQMAEAEDAKGNRLARQAALFEKELKRRERE